MGDPLIICKDLHKHYKDGDAEIRALDGVDLEVRRGEFLAIAGPSGSGKSTMLNLLGCLDSPTSGRIVFDGEDITNVDERKRTELRNRHIAFVFQNFNLIDVFTAIENVGVSLSLLGVRRSERVTRSTLALAEVGLGGLEHRLPSRLSGGQQQRVAVARALVKSPALVLADEPTANLDSVTAREVLEVMKQLNRTHNTTFVFSTHDADVMEFADRLVHLHDGKVVP